MDLYMLHRDRRVIRPILPVNIVGFFESNIAREIEDNNLSAGAFFLDEGKEYEFLDFVFLESASTILNRDFSKYLIISDKLKGNFEKLNPKIIFKPMALYNKGGHYVYWMCKVEPSINVGSINEANGVVNVNSTGDSGGVVNINGAGDSDILNSAITTLAGDKIFRLDMKRESKIVITLEALESILAHGCLGFTVEKIKI